MNEGSILTLLQRNQWNPTRVCLVGLTVQKIYLSELLRFNHEIQDVFCCSFLFGKQKHHKKAAYFQNLRRLFIVND